MQESLKNIDAAQTALQNACKNINEVVASDNQTIKAAKTAAKNSSDSIAASIKTLEAKYVGISDKNSEEAKQLQSSISALKSAKASTDSVQNLKELTGIDTTKMPDNRCRFIKSQGAATIMTNAATLQKSSEALSKALPGIEKTVEEYRRCRRCSCTGRTVKYTDRKCRSVKCRYAGTEQCDRNTAQQSGNIE